MAVKAYEPREGVTGLVIDSLDSANGHFRVGDEDHPWPYATGDSGEQNFLDNHPQVKRAAVDEAESYDQTAEAKVVEKEHNATGPAAALAVEEGVDLSQVQGSGQDGKILLGDVENHLADQEASSEAADVGDEEGGE